MLTSKSVRDLLAAFASSDPTPGGGSASALASATGASLLMMVAALPKTRSNTNDDRALLAEARVELAGVQQQLAEAIDADTVAYDQVTAAYKLPKGTGAEQDARKAAIQRALRGATDVPLGVMRMSSVALRHGLTVAGRGHRGAASDIGVAVALLVAGLRGAAMNVRINIGSLADQAYVEGVKSELDRLSSEGEEAARSAEQLLQA
jgi:formiminotetrahydrofolate cyclodeaminase